MPNVFSQALCLNHGEEANNICLTTSVRKKGEVDPAEAPAYALLDV